MAETRTGSDSVVLTLNAGSTGLRIEAFLPDATGALRQVDSAHATCAREREQTLLQWLERYPQPRRILHRIVHGGPFATARILDAATRNELTRWIELAPLHNGPALQLVELCRQHGVDDSRQVGVFDTAPFADLPDCARRYALPELPTPLPVRRYGFHGLAHESMYHLWRQYSPRASADSRIISLQLGGGCSLAARRGDRILDSSMGFTPLEGVPMSTRCGDTDPGLLLYLLRHGYSIDALDELLNRRSGLAGMSGISGDMKTLLTSSAPAAAAAVELFCYRIRKAVGAYIAVLGGIDTIIFGGGIGEHAAPVRERILSGLDDLGIVLDRTRNAVAPRLPAAIHAERSRCEIWITAVDEAREMLAQAAPLL
jgi:acetate kinase